MEKKARFRDCGLAYLLCLVFIIGISFVLSSIISAIVANEGVDASEVTSRPGLNYISIILSELIFVAVFFIIVGLNKNKDYKKSYRLNFKLDFKLLGVVAFLGIFVMLCSLNLTNSINILFSYFSPVPLTGNLGIPMQTFWQYLIAVLLLAILPSICEELVFRGIIYNGLRQRFSFVVSLVLSSVMFMLVHLSIYKTFYQVILGVVLALLVYYTGTIVYGVVFHFINNFAIITFNYAFGNTTPFEFVSFGVKEILISILIFLIGLTITFLVFKFLKGYTSKHKNYFELEENCSPLENYKVDSDVSYEEKLLNNSKKNEGMALFIISFVIMLICWSFNSFGGFI